MTQSSWLNVLATLLPTLVALGTVGVFFKKWLQRLVNAPVVALTATVEALHVKVSATEQLALRAHDRIDRLLENSTKDVSNGRESVQPTRKHRHRGIGGGNSV